jgi:hypothetical protein
MRVKTLLAAVLSAIFVFTGLSPVSAADVSFTPEEIIYSKDQNSDALVSVAGVSRKTPVVVDWGDGTGYERLSSRCTVSKARNAPASCVVSASHYFEATGSYTVRVLQKNKPVGQLIFTVATDPVKGSDNRPHVGDWKAGTPTYYPCQKVDWFYDTATEPAGRAGTRADIATALDIIATYSGLTFVPTQDAESADMWLSYKALDPNVAGLGGYGRVWLSSATSWTEDTWGGAGWVTKNWEQDGKQWTMTTPGRVWLIVHEAMHAMGIGHSEDETNVMHGFSHKAAQLGSGDIDALASLYLENACPAIQM